MLPPVMLGETVPDRNSKPRHGAVVGGLVAALVVAASTLLLRSTLQVRSVPERLVEWLLLFVPPSLFEAVLQRLGFDAKRYALYLTTIAIFGLFAWLGYVVLRRGWSPAVIGLVGVSVWLGVMLIIMPLTSAGVFAVGLLDGKRAAIGGYLALGLSYAGVLAMVRTWSFKPLPNLASRRLALGLVGGAAVSYIATYLAVLLLPHAAAVPAVVVEDPQHPAPSAGVESSDPPSNAVTGPGIVAAAPAAAADSALALLPEPGVSRELVRGKDGAVVPSTRLPGELADPVTSNLDFYVVTKNAAGDPFIHPADWHLLVDGEVARPFKLDYATLRRLPAVEVTKTLECISNFVGKPELAPFGAELISTAVWKGVGVRDILGLTGGPNAAAAWAVAFGADEYTSALPLEAVMDPATLLVYEMNGGVLPREHGYPARLLVPDRYGMKSPKWLTGLRLMRNEYDDWFGQRSWSKEAIVQTMCRIDTPAPDAELAAGTHMLSGVAYAGRRGIEQVEFSVDQGASWCAAALSNSSADQDQWLAWRGTFDLMPGQVLTILARATDGNGAMQPQAFSLPEPDGGSGWAEVTVRHSS
ncbi:MAG: molybdopterin-dependent oxidoreductase [Chloroflexi bacterium]|nr:molybdopterin-dependent oxidoreductase [Chloroflexota bacterium]